MTTLPVPSRADLGQFMTPPDIARFMASLFPLAAEECRLLDAGAGQGALGGAFLDRWQRGELPFKTLSVTAYEIDESLHDNLRNRLSTFATDSQVIGGDFITQVAQELSWGLEASYTHAILNPPYRKIASSSPQRLALRRIGLETVNLYAAFLGLSLELLAPGGQLVAIVPRSFCNGAYYRPFREWLLGRAAIRHLHLFESRRTTFKADGVLQENVILRLERDGQPAPVTVSHCSDDTFSDLTTFTVPMTEIVRPDDTERFISIPTQPVEAPPGFAYRLTDLGVEVSTGPVVDFRLREHLRQMPEPDSVPLLYPAHLTGGVVRWPIPQLHKPNAIACNTATEKWLYPTGYYCVLKRLTSKEERRRIVATVVEPQHFAGAEKLGFENHLNILHEGKKGLAPALAHGLAVYLNSTHLDEEFRQFSGHTQVNATDLRALGFPSRPQLLELGEWAMQRQNLTQEAIDAQVRGLHDRPS